MFGNGDMSKEQFKGFFFFFLLLLFFFPLYVNSRNDQIKMKRVQEK